MPPMRRLLMWSLPFWQERSSIPSGEILHISGEAEERTRMEKAETTKKSGKKQEVSKLEIIYKDIPVKLGHESNDQSDQDHSPDIARPHIICHKAILLFRIRSRWNHHPISYYNTLLLKKSQ